MFSGDAWLSGKEAVWLSGQGAGFVQYADIPGSNPT